MSIKWSGFDKFKRKIERLEGEKEIPAQELFTDDFIRQNTDFQTLHAMIEASGVKSIEEINDTSFSTFIAQRTRFNSWGKMLEAATACYYRKQLNT